MTRLGGSAARKRGQRRLAVGRLAGLVAELLQRADDRRADLGVVVDDQDQIRETHQRIKLRKRPSSLFGRLAQETAFAQQRKGVRIAIIDHRAQPVGAAAGGRRGGTGAGGMIRGRPCGPPTTMSRNHSPT